jgi:hypothetical protein
MKFTLYEHSKRTRSRKYYTTQLFHLTPNIEYNTSELNFEGS